jgi:hypothetical protein
MLKQHSKLFGGALGTLSVKPIRLKVTDDAKPYHAQPFPVPQAYEGVTKKEIERLILIGVLRKCHESEWAAPTFIQPTKKTGNVCALAIPVTENLGPLAEIARLSLCDRNRSIHGILPHPTGCLLTPAVVYNDSPVGEVPISPLAYGHN